jgi:hypothetical protein
MNPVRVMLRMGGGSCGIDPLQDFMV